MIDVDDSNEWLCVYSNQILDVWAYLFNLLLSKHSFDFLKLDIFHLFYPHPDKWLNFWVDLFHYFVNRFYRFLGNCASNELIVHTLLKKKRIEFRVASAKGNFDAADLCLWLIEINNLSAPFMFQADGVSDLFTFVFACRCEILTKLLIDKRKLTFNKGLSALLHKLFHPWFFHRFFWNFICEGHIQERVRWMNYLLLIEPIDMIDYSFQFHNAIYPWHIFEDVLSIFWVVEAVETAEDERLYL